MVWEHVCTSVGEGKWSENSLRNAFRWHEYGQDPHCFHYTSKDRFIVHPCNAPAPTYTGLRFHSVCISTCRATSGQRDIRRRDIPYSSFASLNLPPPFIRRTAGWTSVVTSENLACLSLQMSPIYLCTFLPLERWKAWRNDSLLSDCRMLIYLANEDYIYFRVNIQKNIWENRWRRLRGTTYQL